MTWDGVGPSGAVLSFQTDGSAAKYVLLRPSGDIVGSIDSILVIGLQGYPVSSDVPVSGYVLAWNGAEWAPAEQTGGAGASGAHDILSSTHTDSTPASPVAGDLIVADSTPKWTRFPIGSQGQKMSIDGAGDLQWAYDDVLIVSSGASVSLDASNHKVILNKSVGSATDVNLPTSPYLGQELIIKDGKGDADVNPITINALSGVLIDGYTSIISKRKYASYTVLWNGNAWNVI